ncbi:non-ribosomal peptide synthetase [Acidicapsa ligni]|uniref:non-ribosomal peptide synthetase n=1 Tax=Acidicapsa ligni TaxID=542300 RepID=UPI0021E0B8C3|nr:amino acid adenylation domain-containing protein [Acidicapsa ligni]
MEELNDIEFLRTLKERGIEVRASEDRLRVNAPVGALTKPMQEELLRRKGRLLTLLTPPPASSAIQSTGAANAPLTYEQEAIWLMERFHPGTVAYSIPEAFFFEFAVDLELLSRSMDYLLQRHEILRCSISEKDGVAYQHVAESFHIPIDFTDLSTIDEALRDAELHALVRQMSRIPFNLSKPPLVRAHLFRLAPARHVAFVNVHHILADRESMDILQHEIEIIYTALAQGRAVDLPPLPIQYMDYAVWEREHSVVLHEQQSTYWKKKLADAPTYLELPFSKPRPSIQTFAGDIEPFFISEQTTAGLRVLALSENASLYMLLLSAFSVLLTRYTGKQDFCIGSPISGRHRTETEPLIGLFVNTVVMRCQPSSANTFRELLKQVRSTALEAYSHSETPFQRLVAELHPERNPGISPLFQIMFALDSLRGETRGVSSQIDTEPGVSKFDLTLQLSEAGGAVGGHFEYRTDLFDRAGIHRFANSFSVLLDSIVHEPDRAISELDLLSATDKQKILIDWNATELDFPRQDAIHTLFEKQVALSPAAIAIEHHSEAITYAQLNENANRLAHHLIATGVRPGECVGICLNRSIRMIESMLAVLKAGGAYVPLDPAYPAQRIRIMLEDSRLAVLITEPEYAPHPLPDFVSTVYRSAESSSIDSMPGINPDRNVGANDLAYVIYTSGSTGRPKGVAIEHHSTNSFLHWAMQTFSAASLQYVLASTSICFDLSIFEIFLPLSIGSTIVLAENALEIAELEAVDKITLINTVPSTMAALIKARLVPQTVRCINLAGEALSASLVRQIEEQLPQAEIFDLYGPTETTTYSTFTQRSADALPTIGRPLANTRIYLLDDHLQPVPIDVPGQIFIAGEGVARGYLHRPDLTAERFVHLSHLPHQDRAYQTGDLARYRQDGNIEYLGRIDQQVKIRGFRIEPGEIESVLREHVQVEDAIVLVHLDAALGNSLIACVMPKGIADIDTAELVRWQRERLPAHMVVSHIQIFASFPLTPNGKVDRKTMATTIESSAKQIAEYTAPRNPLEQKLVAIWESNFERAPIGIDEDFFAIGGHSLLALRVFSDIEKLLGKTLMLSLLLHAPTIRQLASLIQERD